VSPPPRSNLVERQSDRRRCKHRLLFSVDPTRTPAAYTEDRRRSAAVYVQTSRGSAGCRGTAARHDQEKLSPLALLLGRACYYMCQFIQVFQQLDYGVSPAWSAPPPSHGYVRTFGKQPQLASKLLRAAMLSRACTTAMTCLRPSQQSHVGQTSSATVPDPCPKVKPPLLLCISRSSMDVHDLYVQVQDRSCYLRFCHPTGLAIV
jgi:hypothetical protein